MRTSILYLSSLLALFFLTLFLQTNKVEPFESIALRFDDALLQEKEKKIDKDIVFVAVDEQSINTFGRWPWSRDIIADGLKELTQADMVLFDMIFSEPTTPKNDAKLAHAIENLNSSVCGFFLRQKSTQHLDPKALEILDDSSLDLLQSQIAEYKNPFFVSAPEVEINIPEILESCSLSGSFSTLADSDQLLRAYPISVYYNNKLFPSLAIQALRLKFQSDIKRVGPNEVTVHDRLLRLNEKGFVKLNYYKKEQYNIISFLDVYNKKVPAKYFKNKIVILGITEIGSGDVVSTPNGSMYGPLLHYTFLSNFLENQLIKELPSVSSYLMFFFAFLPFVLLLLLKKIIYRILANTLVFTLVYLVIDTLFTQEMLYIDLFYPLLTLLMSTLFVEALAFRDQEKNSKFMREAFSAYLSKELLAQLIKNPQALTLGGEKKELTILFSDIRGFTNISESMDPHSLVTLLNRYFTPMTSAVLEHKGMLDKYIGDAIMAFFNAPVDVSKHADEACNSALDMIKRLDKLNKELIKENITPIKIGIGINTAEVVVGNMGSDTRFNYTVMGDGVNLASRIEALTKNYGVAILITEFTVAKLSDHYLYRKIEPVAVKGKEEPVLLYELLENTTQNQQKLKLYNIALESYMNRDIQRAKQLFGDLADNYKDTPSKYFLEQIEVKREWGLNKMLTK